MFKGLRVQLFSGVTHNVPGFIIQRAKQSDTRMMTVGLDLFLLPLEKPSGLDRLIFAYIAFILKQNGVFLAFLANQFFKFLLENSYLLKSALASTYVGLV
jgi:hypothetical protein